ncbi:PAS domain S-box protein [Clostridium beijerinckii]|uniref:PAS domain S-box protein n=1 Tax=Clostridium beijerinckii TaxID=1520 RepID=UPI0022E44A6A|nr:PAS domain S-box protein [Clostridium beijerinckii]
MNNVYRVLILSNFQKEICAVLEDLPECNLILCFEQVDSMEDLRKVLEDGCYDIIISDYIFNNISVYDLFNIMCQNSFSIPIILISQKISRNDMFKSIKAGINDYIEIDDLSRLKYSVFRILSSVKKKEIRNESDLELGLAFDAKLEKYTDNILANQRLMFNSLCDAILIFDSDGNIVEVNNAALDAYGYTREELTSLKIFDLQEDVTFLDMPEYFPEKDSKFSILHRKKDNVLIAVNINVIRSICNNVLFVGFVHNVLDGDIKVRYNKENKYLYSSLFSNMTEAYLYAKVVYDTWGNPIDYIPLEVNHAFEKMTGFSREQLIGKKATEINPYIIKTKPNMVERCGSVGKTGENTKFEISLGNNGKTYLVSSYSPSQDYFVNIFSDVTSQKSDEREIIKLVTALEQSPVMIIITDTLGNVEYINPKFTEVTGYASGEVYNRNIRFIGSKKMPTKVYGDMWNVIKSGNEWRGEFINKRKDGKLYYASASISPVRNEVDQIIHYIAIQEDITNKKKTEKELEKSNKKLKKAMKELQVMQKNMMINEKMASIGQLAAGVSHEINNPLGYVISNFDILKKFPMKIESIVNEYKELKDLILAEDTESVEKKLISIELMEKSYKNNEYIEIVNDILKTCDEGLERISSIVRELNFFARAEHNKLFNDYDLNNSIDSAFVIALNNSRNTIQIRKDLGELPLIKALGSKIDRVILNIAVNAVQAINLKGENMIGVVSVRTYCSKQYVYCEIGDNGIGIKKKDINRIFDPFFTTKPVGQGVGLGLSLSHSIVVEMHKGELTIKSVYGKGTIVTITLPINSDISSY